MAKKWRCRPSEADDESAIWVLRWILFNNYKQTYDTPLPIDMDEGDF